ncbi:MAG: hypothetical protein AUH25_05970 [Thaumarchaeota archaeon 13_1_40CM_38_12]|nr:MAG: hypothetical protein AUH25_05970 [Thaumarchaeota archaeon 13_1_40CM_38_12]OLC36525.1 MAG: hypothetical protein AUH84_01260 [Thaumarchaeota archaeon 13_1_40CM_4_38_7]OLC93396.1 MAG: hypothetical protein AUI92_03035 [Thaumarchaeota archaeon 13_1_40CM_3_38_6]OLD40677.1 MAG: hypothetical protein AUI60_03900 [Thaumarchaeota archaeon 13_1_40CM_2_39_4]TLY02995.1 MAG: hypothetical protein E6K87_06780 [Nitrososphaerota archaeon]
MKYLIGMIFALFLLILPSVTLPASQGVQWDQNLVPEENVVLQKNIVYMHISTDNKLPFACVWGTVQNAAPGYPVVIQIYKDGKPVYFAQTDVKNDGSYEHYFRVKNVDGDKVLNIFQGDYTVDIFKAVVKNPSAGIITQT